MDSKEVRERYLEFFERLGHVRIDPAPLVLPNDPTTLFTSSGMQPLVPYLMGETHPKGKRLVNVQPAVRTGDIEEVGDNRHLTFFEMLGNWSLGDYFKAEQLPWIFEFYTNKEKGLGLNPQKIYVSVFEGNSEIEKDFTSIDIWKNIFETVGMEAPEATGPNGVWLDTGARIFPYDAKKNWWSRSGTPEEMPAGEIGGPDSELFYDFGKEWKLHENSPWRDEPCHPNCDCGRFVEIGNCVFIQYKKLDDGTLGELHQKNVDFGGGFDRIMAAVYDHPDAFVSDLFKPLIQVIEKEANILYKDRQKEYRIIADHIKAAVFLVANGIIPSNKQHGYVLRRLLRRAALKIKSFNIEGLDIYRKLVHEVFSIYEEVYLQDIKENDVVSVITDEIQKFEKTLSNGVKILEKMENPTSKDVFDLYQTYGFPLELTKELLEQKGQTINLDEVWAEMEKHQENSRTTSAGTFKGGLADSSEVVTKLHTATHLLQASLRRVLGEHVIQRGQNITTERSRFDFSHEYKLTEEELKEVEDLINEQIAQDLPVKMEKLPKEKAIELGAIHAFNEKYGDEVQVYYVGDSIDTAYSKEFCGGPHVTHTGEIGRVRIKKQEKIGAGVIRLYLILE